MLYPLSACGFAIAAAVSFSLVVPVAAQDSKSAPLARELAQLLEASKADSIGAADPTTGGFVAAIYIPGTQLLVAGGKFATPDIGTYRIGQKEFRELYMDLTGGSDPASRIFAEDMSANGILPKTSRDIPADTWAVAGTKHAFEGPKKAKLKDEEYTRLYAEADAQYARILALLISQAKPKSGS